MRLGVHVSIAGAIYEAIDRAQALKCDAMQIFSRNPRGWQALALRKEDVDEFKARRAKADIHPLVVHIPYLINLASPEDALWRKSIGAYIEDIQRADALDAEYFVTHLGSNKGRGETFGLPRFIEAMNIIVRDAKPKVEILLENTSGAGSWQGFRFESIGRIIKGVKGQARVGLCFDTCHAYAAGYDIKTKSGLEETLKEIEKYISLLRLKVVHINDSKGALGSKLDRHEHIGRGEIGLEGFRRFVNHPKLRDMAYILETPKQAPKFDPMNLRTVRQIYKG